MHLPGEMKMDLDVIKECQKLMPDVSSEISKGFSYSQSKNALEEVNRTLRSAFKSLKSVGLQYLGYEHLPLYDQVRALSRTSRNNNKRSLEVTHTTAFAVCCKLKYTDPVTKVDSHYRRNLMIPYLLPYNEFINRDSSYIFSPTLGDRVFSLDNNSIYVPLSRTRVTFVRTPYWFTADDKDVSIDVHRTQLYYESRKVDKPKTKKTHAHTPTLVNYLLCEYGISGMFRKVLDSDIKFGTEDVINAELLGDEWVICGSRGSRSRGRGAGGRSTVKIAVPTNRYSREMQYILAAVFYILDHRLACPGLATMDLDNVYGWKRALASFALDDNDAASGIDKLDSHLESIKHYMDEITIRKMRGEGLIMSTIYDLFTYIIFNFSRMSATTEVASMENKTLSILPSFLFSLTSSIFRMMFEIQKQNRGSMSKQQIEKLINTLWKEDAALSQLTQRVEVCSMDHATDVALLKATSLIVPQAKKGAGSKKMAELSDPAFRFHYSQSGVTTMQMVNKSCPTARNRINVFARVNESGELVPHPDAVPVIENIKALTIGETGV